jgi:hypothetical protein
MDELDRALRTAPREASPGRDLWPRVASRIRDSHTQGWQRAAAAVVIFAAGAAAGALADGAWSPSDPPPLGESALHRVANVQRAGSDYVVAVARLRDLGPADEALQAQGYEAALGVVAVTAEEVAAALGLEDGDAFVGRARAARAVSSRRTSGLLEGARE